MVIFVTKVTEPYSDTPRFRLFLVIAANCKLNRVVVHREMFKQRKMFFIFSLIA
jgi:hypothetical protein